jgi:hypothetical protein
MDPIVERTFSDPRAQAGASAFPVYPRDPTGRLVSPQAVERQLSKIVTSNIFARSKQLCRFLRFVVEETLQGRAESLKESRIGTIVFRRGELFNPGIDPIVRVQARRLRSKVEEYYEIEGRQDPLVIRLRAGSYGPIFESRGNGVVESPRKPVPSHTAALAEIHQSIAACELALNIHRDNSEIEYQGTGADATNVALLGDDSSATMARVNEILLRVLDLTRRVAETPAVRVVASEASPGS